MNEEEKIEEVKEEVVETPVEQEKPVVEEPKTEEVASVPTGNNKKGGNKAIIIIMGIIIVALLAVILVLLLSGNDKSKNNENKQEENIENTENTNLEPGQNIENTEIEPNPTQPVVVDVKVPELDIPRQFCGEIDFDIKSGTVEAKDISVRNKLGMLATAIVKTIGEDKLRTFTAGETNEIDINILEFAKSYFDITPEIEAQLKEGFYTSYYLFTYENNKSTAELQIGGCIGPTVDGYNVKFKESKKENTTLIKTYYYFYEKNATESVVIGKDGPYDITAFPTSYYKDKDSAEPIYKDLTSTDNIDYELFNTFDIYFDITDGNMKLIKIVYNTK